MAAFPGGSVAVALLPGATAVALLTGPAAAALLTALEKAGKKEQGPFEKSEGVEKPQGPSPSSGPLLEPSAQSLLPKDSGWKNLETSGEVWVGMRLPHSFEALRNSVSREE
jgi:hypothetical protein